MGNKLVALVDGSIYSKSVCENAAWLATRSGQPVEVLLLVHPEDRHGRGDDDLEGPVPELATLDLAHPVERGGVRPRVAHHPAGRRPHGHARGAGQGTGAGHEHGGDVVRLGGGHQLDGGLVEAALVGVPPRRAQQGRRREPEADETAR